MTRPNITPGPWHYTKGVSPSVNSQIERTPVNIARTIYGSHDEALANARVIAAVPALLEALEDAIKWSEEAPAPYRNWSFIQKARSALIAAGYQF